MTPAAHSPARPRRPRRTRDTAPPVTRFAFAGGLQRPKAATAAGVASLLMPELRS
jgi:hypothetical protein